MFVETFSVGPLGCNCSIIADLDAKKAVVVDPGGDAAKVQARLAALGVTVEAIVHTHTHVDHVGATAELQLATGAPAMIHEGDRFLYDLLPVQSAMIGCALPSLAQMDGDLRDGSTLRAGALEVGVLHTPGHTPGSVCFVCGSHVFAGDTLFRGSIGRTDLWGGDADAIDRSLRGKLLGLPDDCIVVAGHGPNTTIGKERRSNPFLAPR